MQISQSDRNGNDVKARGQNIPIVIQIGRKMN